MNLFEETALFDEGKSRFTDFQLPDAELKLWEQFFPKTAADHYFQILKDTTPWQQRMRKMYDKMLPDPRLTAYFGGTSGLPWSAPLLEIRELVEAQVKCSFDGVLLNYYRDGNDSVSWHSDTLPADGRHHTVASVTFGATRLFKVRHKTRKDISQLQIPLTHGSLLLMGDTMQDHYEHHVPKTKQETTGRINLTFRVSASHKIYANLSQP